MLVRVVYNCSYFVIGGFMGKEDVENLVRLYKELFKKGDDK